MTDKRKRAAEKQAIYYRNYRRTRDRALVKLAHTYPDKYKELLRLEMAIDEQQNKKWLDLDGNTDISADLDSIPGTKTGTYSPSRGSNHGSDQGNNGGEA